MGFQSMLQPSLAGKQTVLSCFSDRSTAFSVAIEVLSCRTANVHLLSKLEGKGNAIEVDTHLKLHGHTAQAAVHLQPVCGAVGQAEVEVFQHLQARPLPQLLQHLLRTAEHKCKSVCNQAVTSDGAQHWLLLAQRHKPSGRTQHSSQAWL